MKVVFPHDGGCQLKIFPQIAKAMRSFARRHERYFRSLVFEMRNERLIKGNILDAGAYIGDNVAPWAYMNPDITVYAIEPTHIYCEGLTRIAENNNLSNVKIIRTALSDTSKTLYSNSQKGATRRFSNQGKFQENAVSLDHLLSDKQIDDIGFLHLDLEGGEKDAIIGGSALIEKCKPVIAWEQWTRPKSKKWGWREQLGEEVEEIENHLKSKYGYITYMIDESASFKNYRPYLVRNFISILPELENSIKRLTTFKLERLIQLD